MPTISMFYGILVAMMFEDNERHNLPHIHVRYAGHKASIAIEDGSMLAGSIPPKEALNKSRRPLHASGIMHIY